MRVKVDEAGSNDEAGGVENVARGIRCDSSRLRDFGDFVSIEKNISRGVGLRPGVDDAAVLNEKHAKGPFLYPWTAVPRAPAFRQRDASLLRAAHKEQEEQRHAHGDS